MKNLWVNIIFIFLVTVYFSCTATVPEKSINQIVFQKVIDINLSKDDLYKFALNWVKINLSGIDKLVYKNLKLRYWIEITYLEMIFLL